MPRKGHSCRGGRRPGKKTEQDLSISDGGEITYRTKLRLSFKYESEQ